MEIGFSDCKGFLSIVAYFIGPHLRAFFYAWSEIRGASLPGD